ncbi:hypothetical protein CDCA_CDCA09G2743 [Cyanidium caldarium]|uniref:Uncharacterized protein n=1 Tax=Cyanidium caldarium TaxID=2771 RepID=A0AAV9IY42_CYACA|nr:hypothetical protein CDCA_CDCA09G2743 [Cyanidium caldarium]
MGVYPFGWSWRTKGGGRVQVYGLWLTLPLFGGSGWWWWWWQSHREPDRQLRHERKNDPLPTTPGHAEASARGGWPLPSSSDDAPRRLP